MLDTADTPPMGWRSWNAFLNTIDDSIILTQVHALVDSSLVSAGFDRIGIDGGWVCQNPLASAGCTCGGVNGSYHDAQGQPVVGQGRFPNLTSLTAQAHALGVKLDFYGNSCNCVSEELAMWQGQGGNPENDVAAIVRYGMDGIKVDGCGPAHDIQRWVNALEHAEGPPMLLENCGDNHATWSPPDPSAVSGNGSCGFQMYRVSEDIAPQFYSTVFNMQAVLPYINHSRPGCWAYPDMLQVGNAKLTKDESRSHFAMWCIMSSPLILGYDLTDNASVALAHPIVTNPTAIAINQAFCGDGGRMIASSAEVFPVVVEHGAAGTRSSNATFPTWQIWAKRWKCTQAQKEKEIGSQDAFAVLLLNISPHVRTIELDLSMLALPVGVSNDVVLSDVWTGTTLASLKGNDTYTTPPLPAHGSIFLTVQRHSDI